MQIAASLLAKKADVKLMSNQPHDKAKSSKQSEQRALGWVLAINMAQAAIVGGLGWWAQSTGLMGSALDNLGDAFVYAISLFVVGRGLAAKVRVARLSGVLLIVFAGLLFFEVGRRFFTGSDPIGPIMIAVAIASALTNMLCMWFLKSHRESGVHLQASWIFTTNDMLVNSAIALSGLAVILFNSPYPDLIIGLGVVVVVVRSGFEILEKAREAGEAGENGKQHG